MKKFFILLSILTAGLFVASCDIDNASVVGNWKTTQMVGKAYYQNSEVYNYDLMKDTEITWNFTDKFYVNIDITRKGETKHISAPFVYKPEQGILTFLVAKCTDVVLSDNGIDCNIEVSGELLKSFIPDIEGWVVEKNAFLVKIDGEPYYIDFAKFKARLERTTLAE